MSRKESEKATKRAHTFFDGDWENFFNLVFNKRISNKPISLKGLLFIENMSKAWPRKVTTT